jgi:glycosyltransferase involved in cell wall biosynthesis
MKISVIIPIYNMSRYMRDCFDSIRVQTFTDWEVICVDDGSTDDSAKIIDEYMAKDARFRVVHKENGGLSTARNAGLEVAKGEWYTFVDPDDTIVPEWFAHAVELMSDKVDLVRLAVIGNLKWYAERTPVLRGLDASRWCWNVFSGDCPTWLCFVRLNRIGNAQFRTNLRFSEDKLFMLEITPALRGVVQGDFRGYNYRSVEGSLTGKRRPASHCVAFLMACADIWRAQREWAKELGILDLVRDRLQSIVDTDIREWAIMMPPAGGGGQKMSAARISPWNAKARWRRAGVIGRRASLSRSSFGVGQVASQDISCWRSSRSPIASSSGGVAVARPLKTLRALLP